MLIALIRRLVKFVDECIEGSDTPSACKMDRNALEQSHLNFWKLSNLLILAWIE